MPGVDYRYIEINRTLRRLPPEMMDEIVTGLSRAGAAVMHAAATDLLEVNGALSLSVVIARCNETPTGALRWRLRVDTGLYPDLTVVMRMDADTRRSHAFYLFPTIAVAGVQFRLAREP